MTVEPASTRAKLINSDTLDWSYTGISSWIIAAYDEGSLVRRRVMLSRDGIIGWNVRQSFFQRRSGLATLIATTAAGHQRYAIVDVELAEALRVADSALPGLVTPFLVRSA